jgi:hypothetical protein
MKLLSLIFLILFTNYCKAKDSEEIYQKYFLDYWKNSSNTNFQLSTYYTFDVDDSGFVLIKKLLQKVINPNSDKYTIYQADNICHNIQELTEWCHNLRIHQTHYQIDPNNVNTYILDMHHSDNENHIKDVLVKAGRNSKYSDSFFTKSLLNNTDLFLKFHNKHQNILQSKFGDDMKYLVDEIKQISIDNNLIEKGLMVDSIDSLVNYIMSSYLAGMASMEQSTLLFLFLEICKKEVNAEKCNYLSRIMVNSFDSNLVYATRGKDWEVFVHTSHILNLHESEIKKIKFDNRKTKAKISCYISPKDIEFSSTFNREISQQYLLDQKNHGELEASIRMAFKVYETIKENGFNPAFNPNDCE